MKKTSELPQAVNNLRAIWEKKKVEMQFTQVEAAKELGWSQGAISHYLNNITDLGTAATIKFANFLGVDPIEIDPDITEFMPDIRTRVIKYDATNLSKPIKEKIYLSHPDSAFLVRTHTSTFIPLNPNIIEKVDVEYLTRVCPPKDYPGASIFLVQLKGKKEALMYRKENLPPEKTIAKKYAVLSTAMLSKTNL
jgi:transcriptional regulator with XRE-family HTH domain